MSSYNFVVCKFGGTSVSSKQAWNTISDIIQSHLHQGRTPVIVCSALSGISNTLETLMKSALENKHEHILQDIIEKHQHFAKGLGVDAAMIQPELDILKRLTTGASLINHVTPHMHAQIMSCGELMLTKLGHAFLAHQNLNCQWLDARKHLTSENDHSLYPKRAYLAASCHYEPDTALQKHLSEQDAQVFITQGFIGQNTNHETVILGRGGSDISGTYFASKLQASFCEIWTDVSGIYSANPQWIPSAQLLPQLDYEEAQEITSAGAKVLHPRCIAPAKQYKIPIHIRNLQKPDQAGTIIKDQSECHEGQVKAISSRNGIILISMETIGMWQQVGFLADVFACFKRHDLSIDLVSTSETNVTVSLDKVANALDSDVLAKLQKELEPYCHVSIITNCSMISIVGQKIRTIMHRLASVLEIFIEHKIHLISQASNDLNLTLVVEENQAERLVQELHALLFEPVKDDPIPTLKPGKSEVYGDKIWWIHKKDHLLTLCNEHDPLYVYDQQTVKEQCEKVKLLTAIDKMHYAVKANIHPQIIKTIHEAGIHFECVSMPEVRFLLETIPDLKKDPTRILFTPNFAGKHIYQQALDLGVLVTLDNLHPIQHWPELFKNKQVLVRLDPGKGQGHHQYVHTAGAHSKFGIWPEEIEELLDRTQKADCHITGLHAHTGSGILKAKGWEKTAIFLAETAPRFPDVQSIDLGGGLGIPEKPGQQLLDIAAVNETILQVKQAYPHYEFWMEPGRYIVAQSGVILSRVTQLKTKGHYHYVGINAGMHSIIRPMLYGAYHEVANLSKLGKPYETKVNIVGPICESGDTIAHDRWLPKTEEGDIILISTAGAYGRVMSSQYNLHSFPAEYILEA